MKPLRITDSIIKRVYKTISESYKGKYADDKLNITIPTKYAKIKAEHMPNVVLTEIADTKIKALVTECTKEIAWHGLVDYDASTNTYTITDIIVFPQTITASTVQSNDETYGPWLMQFSDEDFNRIRFHGHSHVNMGTSPSAIDMQYHYDMMDRTKDFYIFAIYNKKGEYNIWIYDVAHNLVYEKEDINYVATPIGGIDWAKQQIKEYVSEVKINTTVGFNTNKTNSTGGNLADNETAYHEWWKKAYGDDFTYRRY